MKPCYFYKCKYNASGCSQITEDEFNKINLETKNSFEKDKNINKTHSFCHNLPKFFNSVFILINNK